MSVLFGPLAALWTRLGARPYDAMYRRGAPWDNGPRAELVALLDLPTAHPAERAACYWMTRRGATAGPGGAP